nr:MAG TPA: putative transcriptional regulator [Caudoviricetes sp.]
MQHQKIEYLQKVLDILQIVEYSVRQKEVNEMQFSPKMARQFAGLTQVEMAKKLGISRDTYRRIEAHPETATISQGKMIAAVTGVSFDTIFFGGNSTKSRVSA